MNSQDSPAGRHHADMVIAAAQHEMNRPRTASELRSTIRAIRARLLGLWDDPDLLMKGDLSTDTNQDIIDYCRDAD